MRRHPERLVVELLSDTTFGRGEGTAGLVDVEIEHDSYPGLSLNRVFASSHETATPNYGVL
jgi:hypothetical protein